MRKMSRDGDENYFQKLFSSVRFVTTMCGILCGATTKNEFDCCRLISSAEVINGIKRWECDDKESISAHFIEKDLNNDLSLSKADCNKLKNLEELARLNKELAKLNNTVKAKNETFFKRETIQARIHQIIGESDDAYDSSTMGSGAFNVFERLMTRVACRGPDYVQFMKIEKCNINLSLFSSVLSLRQPFEAQPVERENLILQFNGELYNPDCLKKNDTDYIVELLEKNILAGSQRREGILQTIVSLKGEFALVITDLKENKIYFGRDFIGRRSLMLSHDKPSRHLIISSLSSECDYPFSEISSSEIGIFDMGTFDISYTSYYDLWDTFKSNCAINFKPLNMLHDRELNALVERLYSCLYQSCSSRLLTVHPLHAPVEGSKIGVLFSGGLDCTVVAALLCEQMKQSEAKIDLITVGFQNPRTGLQPRESPDRKLSKKSWFHLAKKYNSDIFEVRLLEIDVSYREWLLHRKRVQKLMFPCNTEMDLSIAIAFYFASRASDGTQVTLATKASSWPEFEANEEKFSITKPNSSCSAEVLFSGLGADELFAGYSRHEAIFHNLVMPSDPKYEENLRSHYDELGQSLMHDIKVIDSRNLGRDDRVVSSWGKELRYPYLDEDVINFATNEVQQNLKMKIDWETKETKKNGRVLKMKLTRKYILRELALFLGLEWVQFESKRAIQFGAKSAKMELGQNRTKGTDIL